MTNSNKNDNLREVPKRICPYTREDYERETKEIGTHKENKSKKRIQWSQQCKKINIDHIYDLWFGKESVDNRIIIVMMCLIIAFIAIPVVANFIFHKKIRFDFFALIDIYISTYIVIVYGNKYLKQGCLKKFIRLVAIIWILPYMLIKFIFEKIFKLKTLFGHIEWMLVIIMLSMTIEIVSYIWGLYAILFCYNKLKVDIQVSSFLKTNIFTQFVFSLGAVMVMYYLTYIIFMLISKKIIEERLRDEYKNEYIMQHGVELRLNSRNAHYIVDEAVENKIAQYYGQVKLIIYFILVFLLFYLQNRPDTIYLFGNRVMQDAINFFIVWEAMTDKWKDIKD